MYFSKKGRTSFMVSPSLMFSSVLPRTSRIVSLVIRFFLLSDRSRVCS